MPGIRAVAVILHNDEVVLIRRVRDGREYFVFPGGGVESGETVEQAVLREVREETSLHIRIARPLYHLFFDDGSEQYFFVCEVLSGQPSLGDGPERGLMSASNVFEPGWYPIRRLGEHLLYPLEIRDRLLSDLADTVHSQPISIRFNTTQLRQE